MKRAVDNFVAYTVTFCARLRRQSLPRRYVSLSGVSVTIEWGT